MPNNSKHISVGGIRCSKIFLGGKLLFEESSLGCETEHPYFFEPCKETSETVAKIAEKFENDADELNNSTLDIEVGGRQFTFKPNVKWCQGDGSLFAELSGLKSAYCVKCPCTENDGNNLEKIRQRFPITRTIQGIHELFDKLASEGRIDTSPPQVGKKRKHKVN